jgi:hypothetical protein
MQIIKPGVNRFRWRGTCYQCECEFLCTSDEIDKKIFNTHIVRVDSFATCPWCGESEVKVSDNIE